MLFQVFFRGADVELFEIHSRKSQSARTKASDRFRDFADDSSGRKSGQEPHAGILFSSDVSARGLDYPLVSHVIQAGAPANRAQYFQAPQPTRW